MILDDLAQAARRQTEEAKKEIPLEEMRERACAADGQTGFPFAAALSGDDVQFICEVKKASPSKGLIAPDFPYLSIAGEYEEAGAAAISVLTEEEYFLGSTEYLREIAAKVQIPVLRKDFIVDPYQIYQAKVIGASAVLLIVALLDPDTLKKDLDLCHSLGLSALVEVHDEREMETALTAGAGIIGVNNRNLKDFTVDLNNCIRLRPLAPPDRLFVAESGIGTAADVKLLRDAGVNAVLIGEAFMRSSWKKEMLEELRGRDNG